MKLYLLYFSLIQLLIGCAPMPEELSSKSSVRVVMPPATRAPSGARVGKAAGNLDSAECYVVLVSWGTSPGKCISSGQPVVDNVQFISEVAIPGGVIDLEINKGPSRQFHLIGFETTSNICPTNFPNLTLTQQNDITNAHRYGSSEVKDIANDIEVIDINISDIGSDELDGSCSGLPFNWETAAKWDVAKWDQSIWGP